MPVTRPNAWPEFSEQFLIARRRTGMTQQEVADAAGVHVSYVCLLEGGRSGCSIKLAKAFADILGVPLSQLTGERDPERIPPES